MSAAEGGPASCTAPKGTGRVLCGRPAVELTDPPRCALHIERDFAPPGGKSTNSATNTSPTASSEDETSQV